MTAANAYPRIRRRTTPGEAPGIMPRPAATRPPRHPPGFPRITSLRECVYIIATFVAEQKPESTRGQDRPAIRPVASFCSRSGPPEAPPAHPGPQWRSRTDRPRHDRPDGCAPDLPEPGARPSPRRGEPSLHFYDDIIFLDPHRHRLRDIGAFYDPRTRDRRNRIGFGADTFRLAIRSAGSNVELPAMPRTPHDLAFPRVGVFARNTRRRNRECRPRQSMTAPYSKALFACPPPRARRRAPWVTGGRQRATPTTGHDVGRTG
jgi:hypothetical protein